MTQSLRKCPENFAETEIDDEIVLMCLTNGDFFSIKDSALAIWNLIDGQRDRSALLDRLIAWDWRDLTTEIKVPKWRKIWLAIRYGFL